MLTTRNVVSTAVLLTLVSLVGACLALMQSPGGGGLGVDSYGTHGHGFRGLFEILTELQVPVERADVPPDRLLSRDMTLALIEPSPEIVSTEPAYLNAIGKWVRRGGTVVVSPSSRQPPTSDKIPPPRNVLWELGLRHVTARLLKREPEWRAKSSGQPPRPDRSADARRAAQQLMRLFGHAPPEASLVHATAEGTLASLFPDGLDLMMPAAGRSVLESDEEPPAIGMGKNRKAAQPVKPQNDNAGSPAFAKATAGDQKTSQIEAGKPLIEGRIRAVLERAGHPETLAAVYAVGRGRIAVLADPRLAQNRFVGQGDNSILITHLLADPRKPVVFDEFYHGLTVRANPLWLLSRFPYDILAASVLAATVLVAWRVARFLGPPLSPRPASRRTLSEYIEAMSRLVNRSQRPVPFLLSEIRQGLLWRIRHDLGLPPGQEDVEKTVRILERRDPALAGKAREAIRAIDDSLAHPGQSAKELEQTLAKVSLCVPRHTL